MASGLDKFPGHAYAPGMEPKFWDGFFTAYSEPAFGPVGSLTIALSLIALLVILARVAGTGSRRRRSAGRGRAAGLEVLHTSGATRARVTSVIAQTLVDRDRARDLRHGRMKPQAGSEQANAN